MDEVEFGRYRLLSLLGEGGMGEVWRAHDTITDRVVAIKVLPAKLSKNEDFQQRFRREAHAAARLETPHVVPIYDYGEIDGRLFVCMRLIKGRDLATVLADGPMEPARAARIIGQVAEALHAAHEIGLIHRDIKPSNILLDDRDFAYLIDFGIARIADDTRMTKTGNTIGTFAYIAPERLDGRGDEDARVDIYSLACVLYECLAGEPPFGGDTMARLVAAHLNSPPPRPSIARSEVPAEVDEVIATGMAKDPDRRYATTVELANAAHDAIATPLTPPRKPTALDNAPPAMPAPVRRAQVQPPPAPEPVWQPLAEPTLHAAQQRPFGSPPAPPLRPAYGPPPQFGTPPPPAGLRPRRKLTWPLAAAAVVILAAGAGITGYLLRQPAATTSQPVSISGPSATSRSVTISGSPTTSKPVTPVTFASWEAFGGIDAKPSADGRHVLLDTHDTVKTWTTKWSGLISQSGSPICSVRIVGRVHDLSHSMDVQGGLGIGLGTLSNTKTELTGIAVQFDFGFNGYRTVNYPADLATPHTPASLNNQWHDIDLQIDASGNTTLIVDGNSAAKSKGDPACGYPVIRVWGGAAEFSDFRVLAAS